MLIVMLTTTEFSKIEGRSLRQENPSWLVHSNHPVGGSRLWSALVNFLLIAEILPRCRDGGATLLGASSARDVVNA